MSAAASSTSVAADSTVPAAPPLSPPPANTNADDVAADVNGDKQSTAAKDSADVTPIFPPSAAEIGKSTLERYELKANIGTSTCVFEARDTLHPEENGKQHQSSKSGIVVLKRHTESSWDEVSQNVQRDLANLEEVQGHRNILKLIDVFTTPSGRIYSVTELCRTDLQQVIDAAYSSNSNNNNNPLRGWRLKSIVQQILLGVRHCHSHRVAHRNLKPRNMLVHVDPETTTGELVVKLSQFKNSRCVTVHPTLYGNNNNPKEEEEEKGDGAGAAASARRRAASAVVTFLGTADNKKKDNKREFTPSPNTGTLWYRAPELLLGAKAYDPFLLDVWSVGCCVLQLCGSGRWFQGETEFHQLFKIFSLVGTPTEKMWPGVSELVNFSDAFPVFDYSSSSSDSESSASSSALFGQRLPPNVAATLGPDGVDLLSKLLCPSPHERTTAAQALKHPWFDQLLGS